jgi:hypothetical protein
MNEICPDSANDPDPLDRLLAAPPLPADGDALRRRVLARTRRALRWRRARRPLAAAAVLAMLGAATLAVSRLPRRAPKEPPHAERREKPAEVPPAAPAALTLEWQAFDRPDQGAALYRQAGDRYLDAEGDAESALRCYAAALDDGGEDDRRISSGDSWLLMAIKDARQKEKKGAQ